MTGLGERQRQEAFMVVALEEAHAAMGRGEVPVGAVIAYEGRVIARTGNRKEELQDPTAHAEILAIRQASQVMGNWRLEQCELYVTLEPCPMCCAAIVAARIPHLWYGCVDEKYGGISLYAMHGDTRLNHQVDARRGLMESECRRMLENFFTNTRKYIKEK